MVFHVHPSGAPSPSSRSAFNEMFQFEIVDADTASVVSSSLGVPIISMAAGKYPVAGKDVMVNQQQLWNQQPNIEILVKAIE
jgi:chromosome partitioning protein